VAASFVEQKNRVYDKLTMSSDPDLSASCFAKSFLSFSMSFFVYRTFAHATGEPNDNQEKVVLGWEKNLLG